jgi:RimJ/RimL family protein N-acetyltransferase
MSEEWLEWVGDPEPWTAPRPLPGPVTTERLNVRRLERGDGPALYRAIEASRDRILPWMAWALTDHQVVDDTVFYVERQRRAAGTPVCREYAMLIVDRAGGEVLGATGLHDIRPALRQAEIGYWVRGDRQGQGLCTEALAGLLGAALRPAEDGGWGFRRIVIYNAVENPASRRVCEKLGLRLELRSRGARYLSPKAGGPGYHDLLGFAVLADEWDASAGRARPAAEWVAPGG